MMTAPVGWLPDGTPYFAPLGRMVADEDRVCCHLCGRWFLSVASHLRVHGWTKDGYIEAFGLEAGNSLAGEATRKRRAAAMAARQVSDPAVREAQRSARERARRGELTAAAAAAARGRAHPLERRRKTLAALASVRPERRAAGYARWNRERLATVAADVARRFGFDDFTAYVESRLAAGLSMAAISREAGLHKDWLCRHLTRVAAVGGPPDRRDQRWRPILDRLGFPDLPTYLRVRHVGEHRTVAAIAAETGVSPRAVNAAMRRHGISRTEHASKRHAAAMRDEETARRLGFPSLSAYIRSRRAAGASWSVMATESGIPETSLRRRRPAPDPAPEAPGEVQGGSAGPGERAVREPPGTAEGSAPEHAPTPEAQDAVPGSGQAVHDSRGEGQEGPREPQRAAWAGRAQSGARGRRRRPEPARS